MTVAYLLAASPLSLFLYVDTFEEARTFFAGRSDSLLIRFPQVFIGAAALLGGWMLRLNLPRHRWRLAAGLLFGAMAAVLFAFGGHHCGKTAAFALCLPGWLALSEWMPRLWRSAKKPPGELKLWTVSGLLLVTACAVSCAAHAVYMLLFAPNLNFGFAADFYLVARVAGMSAGLSLLAGLPFLMLALVLRTPQGARVLLGTLSLALALGVAAILVNGIRTVDGLYLRPIHLLYATALVLPGITLFGCRACAAGTRLAEGFIHFGGTRVAGAWPRPPSRRLTPWLILALFVGAQLLVGRAQLYEGWGTGTSFLYSGLALGSTWYLLTRLSRRLQNAVCGVLLGLAALGLLTFVPAWDDSALWAGYIKFDQSLGTVVKLYHHWHPRAEPELARLRKEIQGSRAAVIGADLGQRHQQQLALSGTARRPDVFFIVVDALRQDTYGGRPEHRQRYPGIRWMAPRFVIYDNTWTSYNGTSGSYPAYLNGILHPAWYEITAGDRVRHDNVLKRACQMAGYRCHDLSTYMPEFHGVWPAEAAVAIPAGGEGLGDPSILLPLALKTLDQQRAKDAVQPAFFYIHLYNQHQPLLRRAGVPFEGQGRHWMRALYEHNALYLDQQVLAFLKGLDQRGGLENSLVILTSDHGEEFYDFGGLYHGWQMNPFVMNVPLFVHYPRHQPGAPAPGTLVQRPVNLIDLAPTICETMGVSIRQESPLQGVSLLSSAATRARTFLLLSWYTPLVGEISFYPRQMSVLNAESGAVDVFRRGEHGWQIQRQTTSPLTFARRLNAAMDELLGFWNPP